MMCFQFEVGMMPGLRQLAYICNKFCIQRYSQRWIVSCGFVLCFVILQGMGFALLAGLPAVYGLYGSIFPGWIYYLFGTSRHLSIGTMALTALIVGGVVARTVPGTLCSALIIFFCHA